mgnify:CR=1 FL=1
MQFKVSPLTKIISLSGFLALGFLLVILSCALFHNYYPLYDILIFLLAPIPNSLFQNRSNYGSSSFMNDSLDGNSGQGASDFGHFCTGMLVTSGITLPLVFYHCQLINSVSCAMSISGGLIIYSSIVIFSWFFHSSWNEDDSNDALFT